MGFLNSHLEGLLGGLCTLLGHLLGEARERIRSCTLRTLLLRRHLLRRREGLLLKPRPRLLTRGMKR